MGLYLGLVAWGWTLDGFPWMVVLDPYLGAALSAGTMVLPPGDCSAGGSQQAWDFWQSRLLRAGVLPLWQPFQGLGSPLWANGQSAPLNPLKWLLVWSAEGPGYQSFLLARVLVLWWGMRALGRALGWKAWGSDAAALSFAASGPMVLEFTLPSVHVWCWLPWWVLLAWRWGQGPSLARSASLGAFTGLMAWMGHAEIALIGALGVLVISVGVAWQSQRMLPALKQAPLAVVMALLVGAPMWLPFLAYLPEAGSYIQDRGHSVFFSARQSTTWKYALENLLRTALNPWGGLNAYAFQVGAGSLALVGGLLAWRWSPALRPMLFGAWGMSAFAILFFEPTSIRSWLPAGPSTAYAMTWLPFAGAVGLGACAQALVEQASARRLWVCLHSVLALFVLLQAWWLGDRALAWSPVPLSQQVGQVLLWSLAPLRPMAPALSVASVALERGTWVALGAPAWPRLSTPKVPELIERTALAERGQLRVASGGVGFRANLGTLFELRQWDFQEAWFPKRYIAYHALYDPRWFGVLLEAGPEAEAGPWLDLAAVSHRVMPPLAHQGPWRFEARPHALPRARILGSMEAMAEGLASQAAALKAQPEAWRSRLLVELPQGHGDRQWLQEGGASAAASGPHGQVRWLQDDPNDLAWEVNSPKQAWLVVADQWASGWECQLDGQSWRMAPAYMTMRAVPLPAGRHVVSMRYRPWSIPLSLALGALGLGLWAVLWWWDPTRKRGLAESAPPGSLG